MRTGYFEETRLHLDLELGERYMEAKKISNIPQFVYKYQRIKRLQTLDTNNRAEKLHPLEWGGQEPVPLQRA